MSGLELEVGENKSWVCELGEEEVGERGKRVDEVEMCNTMWSAWMRRVVECVCICGREVSVL